MTKCSTWARCTREHLGTWAAASCLVALVLLSSAAPAAGQGAGCEWLPGTRNITSRTVGANRVSYASTPRIRCRDGRYIQADSALQFEASGYMEFIGDVLFRDEGRTLRAARAVYYEGLGRLDAEGDVELIQPDGNEIRGERLRFLREGPQRPREELTVTGGRPTALLYPPPAPPPDPEVEATLEAEPTPDTLTLESDSLAVSSGSVRARPDSLTAALDSTTVDSVALAAPEPVEAAPELAEPDSVRPWLIEADRIFLRGEETFTARGDVEVLRDSLRATSDSLAYDQATASLDLSGRPARIVQGELDLSGRELRLLLPGDVIEEVVAREEGRLVTDSLQVEAPFIRLFLSEGLLDRMVASVPREPSDSEGDEPVAAARGRSNTGRTVAAAPEATDSLPRAHAVGNGIEMRADSLDVVSPAQRLERMIAVGTARAVSTTRDTLNTDDTPEILLHDWIEGDTVIAAFREVPAADGDAERGYQLESLDASLNARSLYRLDPDSTQAADTTAFAARLPVSYVEADGIHLTFVEGEVSRFRYEGLRRGVQLQPVRRPDEIDIPSDTTAVAGTGPSDEERQPR